MDGITIGHTRCNVHHCTTQLASPRDRFCPLHRDQEGRCAVRSCERPSSGGYRTCDISGHRTYELRRLETGKAFLRLKLRAEGLTAASIMRSLGSDEAVMELLDDEEISREVETLIQTKPSKKNPPEKTETFKTALTRRWTNNEQLIVRPCGIIVSRATFFEAEGLSNALVRHLSHDRTHACAHHTISSLADLCPGHFSRRIPMCLPLLSLLR